MIPIFIFFDKNDEKLKPKTKLEKIISFIVNLVIITLFIVVLYQIFKLYKMTF